jgi:chromosome segregation ATPase
LASQNEPIIQDLRRELLTAESRILELQDRIAAKQTEQADAVALLGDAELVLENKITYIIELDRSLNLRIRELEEECDRKTEEIDRRGESLLAAEKNQRELNVERAAVVADLSRRIETANQEINKAHSLARDLDLKRAEAAEKLNVKVTKLDQTSAVLTQTQGELASAKETNQELLKDLQKMEVTRDAATERITALENEAAQTNAELNSTTDTVHALELELSNIKTSLLWRWGRPWRALFGPKS